MTVEGGTSGAVFLTFVREHLLPVLRPGDVLVMDNLGAHHATAVKDAIAAVTPEDAQGWFLHCGYPARCD